MKKWLLLLAIIYSCKFIKVLWKHSNEKTFQNDVNYYNPRPFLLTDVFNVTDALPFTIKISRKLNPIICWKLKILYIKQILYIFMDNFKQNHLAWNIHIRYYAPRFPMLEFTYTSAIRFEKFEAHCLNTCLSTQLYCVFFRHCFGGTVLSSSILSIVNNVL